MFDCWVSNPDRHHENWGIIIDINDRFYLAPTYDHASGLGCRIADEERRERLNTNDKFFSVAAFVSRAKSAFYGRDLKILKTCEVLSIVTKQNVSAKEYWFNKIESITKDQIHSVFKQIPGHLITPDSIEFAKSILEENKKRIRKI